MQYALVDGIRRTPIGKGESALCPGCNQPVRAKAGEIYAWHWAHHAGGDCDPWHDPHNEGPWHRAWKALTKPEAQEITIKRDGVHHRADVVGAQGRVIEFQHSPLSPEEIQAREAFYGSMVWVFDGGSFDLSYERDLPGIKPLRREYPFHPVFSILAAMSKVARLPFPGGVEYRWKHAKRSLSYARKPVYIDLGTTLPGTSEPGNVSQPFGVPLSSLMLRLDHYERSDYGTIIRVRLLTREAFMRRHLYSVLRPDLVSHVEHEAAKRAIAVQAFRLAKRHVKAVEQREEAERKALEQRKLDAHRALLKRIDQHRRELAAMPWPDLQELHTRMRRDLKAEGYDPANDYEDVYEVPAGIDERYWVLHVEYDRLVVGPRQTWLAELETKACNNYGWWTRQRQRVLERQRQGGYLPPRAFWLGKYLDRIEAEAARAHQERSFASTLDSEDDHQSKSDWLSRFFEDTTLVPSRPPHANRAEPSAQSSPAGFNRAEFTAAFHQLLKEKATSSEVPNCGDSTARPGGHVQPFNTNKKD